jgi:ribosome-binding protein aMBF1 (putative translation factor)
MKAPRLTRKRERGDIAVRALKAGGEADAAAGVGAAGVTTPRELARTRARLFAEALAGRRRSLGISREELAERAGLDLGVLAEIEGCQRGPDLEELFELAEALDACPEELWRSAYREDNRELWERRGW